MCVLRIKATKRHNIDGFPLGGGVKNLAIEEQKRKKIPSVETVTLNIPLKGNVTGVYPFAELLSSITSSEIAIRPLNDCRL